MDLNLNIIGLPEADIKLNQVEPKLRLRILQDAAVQAAQVVLSAELQLAPVRTGRLVSSGTVVGFREGRRGVVGARAVFSAFYARFQNFGWRLGRRPAGAHSRAKTLRFLAQLIDTRRKIEGKHFAERAAQLSASRVVEVFRGAIQTRLEEVVK